MRLSYSGMIGNYVNIVDKFFIKKKKVEFKFSSYSEVQI